MSQNQALKYIKDIPKDRKHWLLLRQSMGALFPRGTGTTPVLMMVAEMHSWDDPMNEPVAESLLVIDAAQLPVLKRCIDRLLAQMEERGQHMEDIPKEEK